MTFREALDEHLRAIRERDLSGLQATLPADELILISSDGRLFKTVAEFLELHRGWFAETSWSLDVTVVHTVESAALGVAVLLLDYRDNAPGREPLRQLSYLTLIFARRDGRWEMIHDQNTPIRSREN
jgi:ketosteroid isomerase-like protein